MAASDDLASEQAHLDRAYARLDAMRAAAAESLQLALAHGKGGGTYQTLVERGNRGVGSICVRHHAEGDARG